MIPIDRIGMSLDEAESAISKAKDLLEGLEEVDPSDVASGNAMFCSRCFDTSDTATVRDIGTTCLACKKGVLLPPAGMIQQVLAVGGKKQ